MNLSPLPIGSARQYISTRYRRRVPVFMALLSCAAAGSAAAAQQPCADFSWNVQHERDLFASTPQMLSAGTSQAGAPSIRADQFYELQLAPQQQVHFVTGPGKAVLSGGDYAGLVKLRVSQAGSYRVSVDAAFWIDVVAGGKMLGTKDFQGQRGCRPPRKIVEFVLPANQELWLQFSDEPRMQLHVTVTRSPPAKS